MLKYRFIISFISTTLLYISAGLFFYYLQHHYVGVKQKPKEKTVSISLSKFIPTPQEPTIVEEVVEPETKEPEVKEITPEPIVKKVDKPIVEEVIPEPVKPKILPKKRVKKKLVKKRKVKKVSHKKKSKKKRKHIGKRVNKSGTKQKNYSKKPSQKSSSTPAKKNAFLAQVRSKISRNKTYPRIAQRRRMQGLVKVKFTILPNGNVGNISVSGPKVFHNSAKNAVKRAFPIGIKNIPISLPIRVNFTLHYQVH